MLPRVLRDHCCPRSRFWVYACSNAAGYRGTGQVFIPGRLYQSLSGWPPPIAPALTIPFSIVVHEQRLGRVYTGEFTHHGFCTNTCSLLRVLGRLQCLLFWWGLLALESFPAVMPQVSMLPVSAGGIPRQPGLLQPGHPRGGVLVPLQPWRGFQVALPVCPLSPSPLLPPRSSFYPRSPPGPEHSAGPLSVAWCWPIPKQTGHLDATAVVSVPWGCLTGQELDLSGCRCQQAEGSTWLLLPLRKGGSSHWTHYVDRSLCCNYKQMKQDRNEKP